MKKIEFGYNTDKRLNATWSEIEPYNGEYLDKINCENMDFLITRVVDSYHGLNGSIDVREVIQDYYADGSYVTYANKEKNGLCQKLEEFLNQGKIKEKLKNERALEVLRDAEFPAYTSRLLNIEPKTEEFAEVVTSIKPEMFKKLKDSKKNFGMSMFNMHEEIQRLYKEIEKLKLHSDENTSKRHY